MFSRKGDASMAPGGKGFHDAASKLAVLDDQRAALTPVAEISQPTDGHGVFQMRRQRPGPRCAPFEDKAVDMKKPTNSRTDPRHKKHAVAAR
jgi:hypothetical protein